MTRDDIIRMAREGKSVVEQVHAYVSANNTDFTSESMAAMVKDFIAAEREACAKVCDEWVKDHAKTDDCTYADCDFVAAATDYAKAIRAMGNI